jgi:hypothetical protein
MNNHHFSIILFHFFTVNVLVDLANSSPIDKRQIKQCFYLRLLWEFVDILVVAQQMSAHLAPI